MDLQSFLKNKVVRNNKLYTIFLDEIGAGPLDAGCYAFAAALQKVLGEGSLYSVVDKGIAQHVVLKVGSLYVDADGAREEKAFLKRQKDMEDYTNPTLRLFKESDVPDSPRSESLINKLAAYLSGEGKMSKAKRVKEMFEDLHDFDQVLRSFIEDSQKKIDADESKYQYSQHTKLETMSGAKYIRIVAVNQANSGKSAWAFVDKETGDVFKPASWKVPAKHARANIFKPNTWSSVTAYGPAYLR